MLVLLIGLASGRILAYVQGKVDFTRKKRETIKYIFSTLRIARLNQPTSRKPSLAQDKLYHPPVAI